MPKAEKSAAALPKYSAPVPMLDLHRQYAPIKEELLAALEHVLETQQFILGEQVRSFEEAAARHLGVSYAIGCSSGTDALWLALAASGVGHDDGVITTPFSFFASASAILRAGARPVFADIDPSTFNLAPQAAEAALEAGGIRAILPVHLYGQCADWTALEKLARAHGLKLIEDAAQAWGAAWEGRPAGGLGVAAAFSFYPTKNLSAAGDAGMVTTNDETVAERVQMLRQHGMRRRYHHDDLGWNARLDGFQGAVLEVKLKYVAAWNQARRRISEQYHELFRSAGVTDSGPYPDKGIVVPRHRSEADHVWHQYVIRCSRRDDLHRFLTSRKIGSEIYYPVPLHLQEALQSLGHVHGEFPEAERAAREVLALPIFPELREEEIQAVVSAVVDFLN